MRSSGSPPVARVPGAHTSGSGYLGLSPSITDRAGRFAATEASILIQGEAGTGKSELAEWLHQNSGRSHGPFHRINLAGLDNGFAGSELFGHVRGAFTGAHDRRDGAFATANQGTLFLDELGKSSRKIQRKLLEVLERRTYRMLGSDRTCLTNARLIFAANEPLETLVAQGKMLADFLARIGLFRVVLPPLRERAHEIPGLLRHFVRRHAKKFGWPADTLPVIDPSLDEALAAYTWPQNARELEHVVQRLLTDARGLGVLSADLLVDDLAGFDSRGLTLDQQRESRTQRALKALERTDGNRTKAAADLGISRTTFYDHLGGELPPKRALGG